MAIRITKSGKLKTTITESEFQQQVIDYAHLRGYKVAHFRRAHIKSLDGKDRYKTPVDADGKGFQDLTMIRKRDGRGIAAELKVHPNKATQDQLDWLAHFKSVGFITGVYYPEDWDELIKAFD